MVEEPYSLYSQLKVFANMLALGRLGSQFPRRNVMNAGVVPKSTGIGYLKRSSRQTSKTPYQLGFFRSRLGNQITANPSPRRCPFAMCCYRILIQTFSPFGLLSGYASLNMSPMMRAPEVTAPGKSNHSSEPCMAAHGPPYSVISRTTPT